MKITMDKTLTNKLANSLVFLALAVIAGLVVFAFLKSQPALGEATSGLPATYATSSTLQVGPNYVQVLSVASNSCTSRAISTGPTAIRLSFGGSATSTATSTAQIGSDVGLWQAASTTVAYDGGQYGCGFVGVIGQNTSTSTVSIEEFN